MSRNCGAATYDGFFRLTLDALLALPMAHLTSGIDDDAAPRVPIGGIVTLLQGYTEWTCDSLSLSLGWDWSLDRLDGEVICARIGLPRSNIMLIGSRRTDLGWQRNLDVLATFVDSLPWVESTRRAVGIC